MFDFDYRWEVYKPAKERQYGYYVLPVVFGDRFIGRFEPGLDRSRNELVIKNWWWEPGIIPTEDMLAGLQQCFREFMSFTGTDRIRVDGSITKGESEERSWLSQVVRL